MARINLLYQVFYGALTLVFYRAFFIARSSWFFMARFRAVALSS